MAVRLNRFILFPEIKNGKIPRGFRRVGKDFELYLAIPVLPEVLEGFIETSDAIHHVDETPNSCAYYIEEVPNPRLNQPRFIVHVAPLYHEGIMCLPYAQLLSMVSNRRARIVGRELIAPKNSRTLSSQTSLDKFALKQEMFSQDGVYSEADYVAARISPDNPKSVEITAAERK